LDGLGRQSGRFFHELAPIGVQRRLRRSRWKRRGSGQSSSGAGKKAAVAGIGEGTATAVLNAVARFHDDTSQEMASEAIFWIMT
jgi:hypothetical protein